MSATTSRRKLCSADKSSTQPVTASRYRSSSADQYHASGLRSRWRRRVACREAAIERHAADGPERHQHERQADEALVLVAVAAHRQLAPQEIATLRRAVVVPDAVPRREDGPARAGGARKHDEQRKGCGRLQRRRHGASAGLGSGERHEQRQECEGDWRRRGEQHAVAEASEALCGQNDAGPVEINPVEPFHPVKIPVRQFDE
eukprot:2946564-Prymnesium_polylepis.2